MKMLYTARVGLSLSTGSSSASRPKGVFFFVGPTGVGKTELAKAMAQLFFNDEKALSRFDMSEYAQEHAAERLTGAPPSYVGYEAGGQLTNLMKRRPFSLLLFDEIEKAHPRLLDRFLQILDDGRLTDGQGDTVYFGHSVIVFTSNLGSTREEPGPGNSRRVVSNVDAAMPYDAIERLYRKEVSDHFRLRLGRPELLNRLGDNIIVFDVLRPEHVPEILGKFLDQLSSVAADKRGLRLQFDEGLRKQARDVCSAPEQVLVGGRGIRNFLESHVVPYVNQFVFENDPPRDSTLRVSWDKTANQARLSAGR